MAPLRPSLKPPFCGSGTCKDGMEWPLVACLLIEEENQGLVLCNRVGLKNLLHSIYTSPPPSAEAIKPNCRLFHQRSLASSAGTPSFSAAVLRYLTISIEVSRMSSWIARVIIPIRTGPLLRT
ncbi:hypothetical protein TWF103_006369 [Orbilia oligospora]|nr:hypothetical protein TWF103_006369 [Orbilia oligospora]